MHSTFHGGAGHSQYPSHARRERKRSGPPAPNDEKATLVFFFKKDNLAARSTQPKLTPPSVHGEPSLAPRRTHLATSMVSGGVPLHRGGCGGGGGGPCVRFEAIELLFSDFAGCQFDFAKDGNLVLTFHGYTGTVTLKSAESDKQASPLCGSEAGSLGVLADADTVDDVSMDNVDYDIALSQLEQGDSPKSSPPTILSHPQRQEHQDEESPAGMLFHSPTAMRDACEGKQDELPTKSTTTTIASAPSTTEVRRKKSEGDALEAGGMLLANLVSPSSSVKTSNPSCFANAPSSSHTAPPSPPPSATQGSNKRPAASSLPSSGGHSGGVKKAVSPDSFSPTTSPPSATGCSAASRSKPKRARRARDQEQPQPFLSNSSSKGSAFSSSSPAGAAAASSKNGCRGARRRPSVEVIEESATDDDVGDCQDGCGGLLGEEDGEGERGGAGSPAVVGVPVESAAAAWIASARGSAALPSSPGPLSRSARASEVGAWKMILVLVRVMSSCLEVPVAKPTHGQGML